VAILLKLRGIYVGVLALMLIAGSSGDDGLVDLHDDECCALHALSGPLPKAATIPSHKLISERVEPLMLTVLSGGCPEVLERPPNPMPL
jgi:hypothetical protein